MKLIASILLASLLYSCASTRSEDSLLEEEAFWRRGHSLYLQKEWAQSLSALDRVIELNEDNLRARVLREMVRFESGDQQGSIQRLKELCMGTSSRSSCLVSLGHLYFKAKDWPGAQNTWQEAVDDPRLKNRPLVFYYLAAAQFKQQNIQEAEITWRRSLDQPSTKENCRVRQLGSRILLGQARFKEAVAQAQIAYSLCEGDFESHDWLGFTFYKSAHFNDAEAVYRRALSIFRDSLSRSKASTRLARLKNQEVLDEPDFLL